MTGVLKRRGGWDTGTCRGKPMWRPGRRQPSISQGERSHKKATLLTLWPWTSTLKNWEKINFCCVSPSVCGPLWWQPWQTQSDPVNCEHYIGVCPCCFALATVAVPQEVAAFTGLGPRMCVGRCMVQHTVQWLAMAGAENKPFLFKPWGYWGYLSVAHITWSVVAAHICAQII